eukprot:27806-Chlamydomonas_euryale.AAC.1
MHRGEWYRTHACGRGESGWSTWAGGGAWVKWVGRVGKWLGGWVGGLVGLGCVSGLGELDWVGIASPTP